MAPKPIIDKPKKIVFQNFRTQMEDKLLLLARQYARMKLFGISIDNNCRVKHCHQDSLDQAKFLSMMVLSAAEDLVSAMAIDEIDGELVE